jgi:hypothetical protein
MDGIMRVIFFLFAGVAVAGLIDWRLDKVWRPSKLRSALMTGAGVYVALKLNDLFMK